MNMVLTVLGGAISLYSTLLIIRIFLSWFGSAAYGKVFDMLRQITDPYLDFFRRFPFLRAGFFDFSPIAAIAILSVAGNIIDRLHRWGKVSPLFIAAMLLEALWAAVSFVILFTLIVLALRLAAYIFRANTYSPFWRIIDSIANGVLYRFNKIIFRARPVHYLASIVASCIVFAALYFGLGFLVRLGVRALVTPAVFLR
jgi:YggT family protein